MSSSSVNLNIVKVNLASASQDEAPLDYEFRLDNDLNTLNLAALFQRQQGQKFFVAESGELRIAQTPWQHIKAWFQGPKKIEPVVSNALQAFSRFIGSERDERAARVVKHFFSEGGSIGRLSSQIFRRDKFKQGDPLSICLIPDNVVRLKFGDAGFYDFEINEPLEGSHLLEIDLQNENATKNIYKILTSKPGDQLAQRAVEIQEISEEIIQNIEAYLNRVNIGKIHKMAIRHIFEESTYHALNESLFIRAIKEKRESPFSKIAEKGSKILEILAPKYAEGKQRLINAFKNLRDQGRTQAALRELEEADMAVCNLEFEFVQKLGGDLQPIGSGGSGGARLARDRMGNPMQVVKPGDEGPHGKNNPQWYAPIKRLFISPRGSLYGNSEPLAEVECWLLDRLFGLYVVPSTQLKYVESKQFNGQKRKECSVQRFFTGCEPLSDVVDECRVSEEERRLGKKPFISISSLYRLPRPLLRWVLEKAEASLKKTLPSSLLERMSIGKVIAGDTDGHFGNTLVRRQKGSEEGADLLQKLINLEKPLDKEIEEFVDQYFTRGNQQRFLETLLTSQVNEYGENVWIINIDGGLSCGHSQPNDYFSICFKYLFEALPHFKGKFSLGLQLEGKENQFAKGLMEATIQSLRNILEPHQFAEFWKPQENRELLKQWIFEDNFIEQERLRNRLAVKLTDIKFPDPKSRTNNQNKASKSYKKWKQYYEDQLRRLRGNIETRIENWRLLNFAIKYQTQMEEDSSSVKLEPPPPQTMREFFANTRSESDINVRLPHCADDGFGNHRLRWKNEPVKQGEADYIVSQDLSMTQLLIDFGVQI